jgi:AcrR family transcriptional regulator
MGAVPRRVDHDERRRQITDALLRIASTRGLQAVTMREVAAEAGVSLRLVQYYATDKRTLLLGGVAELAARLDRRVTARAAARGGPPLSARAVLEVVLGAVLPDDEQGRLDSLAWTAFHAAGLTDPSLREAEVVRSGLQHPNALEDWLVARMTAAQGVGEFPADLDPRTEVAALLALANGLTAGVLAGQRSAEDAVAILHAQLDRLLGRDATGGTPVTGVMTGP